MKKLMVVWVLLASFCSVGYSAVTAQYVRFEIPVQPYVGVSGFSYEIVDLKEIQIFANGSTNNISLGKTATSSGLQSGTIERVIDGDLTSMVKTVAVLNPWVEVDLGQAYSIDTIKVMKNNSDGKRPSRFLITALDTNRKVVWYERFGKQTQSTFSPDVMSGTYVGEEVAENSEDWYDVGDDPLTGNIVHFTAGGPDMSARKADFDKRNTPAAVKKLCQRFHAMVQPNVKGLEDFYANYNCGKYQEALDAYKAFFFARMASRTSKDRKFSLDMRKANAALQGLKVYKSGFVSLGGTNEMKQWISYAEPGSSAFGKEAPTFKMPSHSSGMTMRWGVESLKAYVRSGDLRYLECWENMTDDWCMYGRRDRYGSRYNYIMGSEKGAWQFNNVIYNDWPTFLKHHPDFAKDLRSTTLVRYILAMYEDTVSYSIRARRAELANFGSIGIAATSKFLTYFTELKQNEYISRQVVHLYMDTTFQQRTLDGEKIEGADESHRFVDYQYLYFDNILQFKTGGLKIYDDLHAQYRRDCRTPFYGNIFSRVTGGAYSWPGWAGAGGNWPAKNIPAKKHRFEIRTLTRLGKGFTVELKKNVGLQRRFRSVLDYSPAVWIDVSDNNLPRGVWDKMYADKRKEAEKIPFSERDWPKRLSDILPYSSTSVLRDSWLSGVECFFQFNFPDRTQSHGLGPDRAEGGMTGYGSMPYNFMVAGTTVAAGSAVGVDKKAPDCMYDNPRTGGKTIYCATAPRKVNQTRFLTSERFDFTEAIRHDPYVRMKKGPDWYGLLNPNNNFENTAITNITPYRQIFHVRGESIWIVSDRLETDDTTTPREYCRFWTHPVWMSGASGEKERFLNYVNSGHTPLIDDYDFIATAIPGEINVSTRIIGPDGYIRVNRMGNQGFITNTTPAELLLKADLDAGKQMGDLMNWTKSKNKKLGMRRSGVVWHGSGNQLLISLHNCRAKQSDPDRQMEGDLKSYTKLKKAGGVLGFRALTQNGALVEFLAGPNHSNDLSSEDVHVQAENLLVVNKEGVISGVTLGTDKQITINGKTFATTATDFEYEFDLTSGKFSFTPIHVVIDTTKIYPLQKTFSDTLEISFDIPTQDTSNIDFHYTLDGSEPTLDSPLYTGPFLINKDTYVKVRPFQKELTETPWNFPSEEAGATIGTIYRKEAVRPAKNSSTSTPGLKCEYFEDPWPILFMEIGADGSMDPVTKTNGVHLLNPADIDVLRGDNEKSFGLRYSGFINVPQSGLYNFYAPAHLYTTDMDAGFDMRVWIDGEEWFPAPESNSEGIWSIHLAAGYHTFKLTYVDYRWKEFKNEYWMEWHSEEMWQGVPVLEVSAPGIAKQPVPNSWFSYNEAPKFTNDVMDGTNATWGVNYSGTLSGSATDAENDSLTYTNLAGGWLNIAPDGTLSGTPDTHGTNIFLVQVSDGFGTDTAELHIFVSTNGVAPTFSSSHLSASNGLYGVAYSDTLAGKASDPEGDTLIFSKLEGPDWLVVAPDGSLSGTPNLAGTNTFAVRVEDGHGNSDEATLTIFVDVSGQPPAFSADPFSASNGVFDLTYSDTSTLKNSAADPEGGELTFTKIDGSEWLTISPNGDLSGRPDLLGTNTFTVRISDDRGNTDTATMIVFVDPDGQASLPVTNGLYLKLVANDLTLTNNAAVTSWVDSVSGNVLEETKSDVATLKRNAYNGFSAVQFLGTTGSLQDTSLNPTNLPDMNHVTLFVVAEPLQVYSGNQRWLFQGQANESGRLRIVKNDKKTSWSCMVGSGGYINSTNQIKKQLSVMTVVSGKSGGNDVEFRKDGIVLGTGNSGTGNALGKAALGYALKANISEVLIYNRTLSDAEVESVENYLTSRYVPKTPVFTNDLIVAKAGSYGKIYSDTFSLTNNVVDYQGDSLLFTKESGPDWLQVSSSGELSGRPDSIGTQTFTIRVEDPQGHADTVTLQMEVSKADRETTPVRDGLYLELIANDLQLTNGAPVTSWPDTASGNVLYESQPNVATFNFYFTNECAAVRFSGNGSLIDNTLNAADLPDTDHLTLFVVAKPVSVVNTAQEWVFRGQSVGNNRLRIVKDANKTTWGSRVGGGAGIGTTDPVATDLSIFTLVSGKAGGNDVRFMRNGTTIGTGSSGTGNLLGAAAIGLNANTDIAEVLIYNRTLSDEEIAEVYEYLRGKYLFGTIIPQFKDDPFETAIADLGEAYAESITNNVANLDNNTLTFTKESGAAWLNVATDGTLSGTPAALGTNLFVVKLEDQFGRSDTATLQIVVKSPNTAPAFTESTFSATAAVYGTPYSGSIATRATDPDSDPLVFSKISGPDWLTIAPDGSMSGTPYVVGTDTFDVLVDDGRGGTNSATMQIVVDPDGHAPAFTNSVVSLTNASYEIAYSNTIKNAATDSDSDTLFYVKTSGADWLFMNLDGSVYGTPNIPGTNSFGVTVYDAHGNMDTATLQIFVESDLPPSFSSDSYTIYHVIYDTIYHSSIADRASDPEGGLLTFSKVSGSDWLSVSTNGILGGTPDILGTNTFTVKVTDDQGNEDTATLNMIVTEPTGKTPVSDGLYLELIADDLPLPNGGSVTSWTDSVSGNVLAESQANVATYVDNFANGHAAVHFSGAGSLQDASLNLTNRPQTKHTTLFVVAKPRTVASGQSWLFQGQVGANNNRFRIVKDSGKTTWSTRVGGGTTQNTTEQITTNLTVFTLISGKSGTDDVEFFLNGTSISTSKSGNGIALGKVGVGLNFDVDIAEVLVYNRTLSDSEVNDVQEYLDVKYGLAPPPTPLESWQKAYWGSTADPNAVLAADPDHDGIKNGIEFVFGTDPTVPGKLGADKMRFDGTTLTVRWMKPATSGLTYEILENDSMRNPNGWTPVQDPVRTPISESGNFERVKFTHPEGWIQGGENKKFIRIRITQP